MSDSDRRRPRVKARHARCGPRGLPARGARDDPEVGPSAGGGGRRLRRPARARRGGRARARQRSRRRWRAATSWRPTSRPSCSAAGRRRASRASSSSGSRPTPRRCPFDDASFDVVLSSFGAMFAPRHQVVADELCGSCGRAGRSAMANWTPEGWVGQFFLRSLPFMRPPPPGASAAAVAWGVRRPRARAIRRPRISHGGRDRRDRELVVGLEDADQQTGQAEQQHDREQHAREASGERRC